MDILLARNISVDQVVPLSAWFGDDVDVRKMFFGLVIVGWFEWDCGKFTAHVIVY